MSRAQNVFHVSILRICAHNSTHEIDFFDIEINNNVTYNEGPMRVLDHELQKLRNKEIPLVKIQWKYHNEGEPLWELESEMLKKFLYLLLCHLTSILMTKSFSRMWRV